ncbi:MAG: hypothetical protein AAGJ32_07740 [Pseudomonadota bacterium]
MRELIAALGMVCLLVAGPGQSVASAQSCATQSIVWERSGERHGTAILGRLRDGCPVLSQRRGRTGEGSVLQMTGRDCDCDLRIDGMEDLFEVPAPLAARRMVGVCRANLALADPAVSGAYRSVYNSVADERGPKSDQ